MIQKIGVGVVTPQLSNTRREVVQQQNSVTVPSFSKDYTATSLVKAYQAFHGINTAKTVSFGSSLQDAFNRFKNSMFVCNDDASEMTGEYVGQCLPITKLIKEFDDDLANIEDAVKTNIEIDPSNNKYVDSRTQLKRKKNGILCNFNVHMPRKCRSDKPNTNPLSSKIEVIQDPLQSTQNASLLKDKNNKLMVAVDDKDYVILTNEGKFIKKSGGLNVTMKQLDVSKYNIAMDAYKEKIKKGEKCELPVMEPEIKFTPFTKPVIEVQPIKEGPSVGNGAELVIGMEDKRFVAEIIDSIEKFVKDVNEGKIKLPQFVAAEGAQNLQLAMLSGGFGSRAEYTNATSSAIIYGDKNGTQSTKGIFKTATGFTPMETTFITLHKAGLLDCSKGKLKVGDNIKFYLNRSGVNNGNGDFSLGIYDTMKNPNRKSIVIFPNDSMSRMTNATIKMAEIINSGDAAIAMIAKKVPAKETVKKFGIMSIDPNTKEILEFTEKPKTYDEITPNYKDENDMCLTNTFQFAVSNEAVKAISLIEPFIPVFGIESRDWSKSFIPIIMNLTQKDDVDEIRKGICEEIKKAAGEKYKIEFTPEDIPAEKVVEAKNVLGNQKIYAVPTEESWADVGTLDALYDTTMKIAKGEFELEDFERKHVLDSIDTERGVITSNPQMLKDFTNKYYDIYGKIYVAPKATMPDKDIVDKCVSEDKITIRLPQDLKKI